MAGSSDRPSALRHALRDGILASLPDGVAIVAIDSTLVGVNPALEAMSGYDDAELAGAHPPYLFFGEPDSLAVAERIESVLHGDRREFELPLRCKNGRQGQVLVTPGGSPAPDSDPGCALLLIKEISARKLREFDLLRSRQQLQLVIDTIPQRMFWKDRQYRYLGCNRAFASDTGLDRPEDIVGCDDFELMWKESAPLYRADDRDVMENDRPKIGYEEPQVLSDGTRRWLRTSKIPLKNDRDEIIGVFGSYEDITAQKLADEAVRRSEEKYRNLIEQAIDAIFLTDAEGNVLEGNSAGEELLGYERSELRGLNLRRLIASDDLDSKPLRLQGLASGETVRLERVLLRKDGTRVHGEVSARQLPDGNLIGIVRDLTEQRRLAEHRRVLEAQLRQSHKMEALGTLAGGIAHDFNNILQAICGYAELLGDDLEPTDPRALDAARLLAAGHRGRQVVQQILAFARADEPRLGPILIDEILQDSKPLIRATLPAAVELRYQIRVRSARILGDEGQVHQLLLNLTSNAVHAMRERGGTLSIGLEEVHFNVSSPHRDRTLSPGRYYRLEFEDTGVGIDPECVDRIFDPFFTTKRVGEGTGMGLALVHAIVAGFGGVIDVTSRVGHGTRFELFLPHSTARERPSTRVTKQEAPASLAPGQGEFVLFIDNEEALVDLGSKLLDHLGYRSHCTTSVSDAREFFDQHADELDLVVTDLSMPQRNGVELAQEFAARRPDLPIVLVTGFGDEFATQSAAQLGLNALVLKPYTRRSLAQTIRDVLDGKTLL